MKRVLAAVLCVSALVFGLSIGASAAAEKAVLVKVPFPFQVGNALVPAGEYVFELPRMGSCATGSMLKVYSKDRTINHYLLSRTIPGVTSDQDWHIGFAGYGGSYFLAKVRNGNVGAELSKSQIEKKLAAEYLRDQKAVASLELKPVYSRAK